MPGNQPLRQLTISSSAISPISQSFSIFFKNYRRNLSSHTTTITPTLERRVLWHAVTKSLVTEAQVAEIPTTETQGFGHSLWRHDTQHKGLISDIQHNDTANMLNVVVPSVVIFYCYA